jgi:hypothetical protein
MITSRRVTLQFTPTLPMASSFSYWCDSRMTLRVSKTTLAVNGDDMMFEMEKWAVERSGSHVPVGA